jgi:hypothetical protein
MIADVRFHCRLKVPRTTVQIRVKSLGFALLLTTSYLRLSSQCYS